MSQRIIVHIEADITDWGWVKRRAQLSDDDLLISLIGHWKLDDIELFDGAKWSIERREDEPTPMGANLPGGNMMGPGYHRRVLEALVGGRLIFVSICDRCGDHGFTLVRDEVPARWGTSRGGDQLLCEYCLISDEESSVEEEVPG